MKNLSSLFFVAVNLLAVWMFAPQAQGAVLDTTLTTLATFNNTNGGGANPFAPPVLGADGALYGTTAYGDKAKGTNFSAVIYEITTNGENLTLHTFSQTDGTTISAPLIFGGDGNLYGVASAGGTNNFGTIYRMGTNGTFAVLHTFGSLSNQLDGASPIGGLLQGQDGNFYGTTYGGGTSNLGTVFQFSTNNNVLRTLWSFSGAAGGAHPQASSLVEGPAGVFYGTTYQGGISNCGTIFKVTAGGGFESMFQFSGANGQGVFNGVSFGVDGDLFGTTLQGGASGDGTVFRLDAVGNLTTLYQFKGSDGMFPQGGITVGPNEVLFGATLQGGAKGFGTVFQLITNGSLTTLYSFTNSNDGSRPAGGVILAPDGSLYGTTDAGGTNNGRGTVYHLQYRFLPTVAFTAPKANQRWSNDVFMVKGTATGNLSLTNVAYSVNGGAWTNATTTNSWTNWTGQVTLTPGTNTIAAYSTDAIGSISPTNTIKLDYVVTTPVAVLLNGAGSVSPDYNNESLHIGTTYSMTAKADQGSKFTGWTDGNSNSITLLPKLTFVMTNNLSFIAFFADTNGPSLAISVPKSGARTSNDTFVITGTAKDNVVVSRVLVSVNGGVWADAGLTSGKGETNWSASVGLAIGTNTIAAYAEDASGNLSVTDTVRLDYIVTAPITVNIVGSGTLNPNYNGKSLAINSTYSMKATPAKGFGFYFWNGGVPMSSNPTLVFTMTAGLSITANFRDITTPVISITSPKANAKFSNDVNVIHVQGKATDNVAVTSYGVRINHGEWNIATAASNSVVWSLDASPVIRGTNILEAFASDAAGNLATNTVKFIGILPPDWAPDALADSTMEVTPSAGDPVTVSFGATNFSQVDILATNGSGTGLYTYIKTDTNAAGVELNYVAPPNRTNDNPQDILLNFTGLNAGTYTNVTSTDTGTFDIVPAATLVPSSFKDHTITLANATDNTKTVLQIKSATSASLTINGSTITDTYTATADSPVGAMLVVIDPGANEATHYLQLTFTTKSAGHYEVDDYDSGGNYLGADLGTFTFK